MLKSVDPLLSPELLFVLASMGHGDDVVLADANFPAAATAKLTAYGSVVWLPGVDLPTAARAILTVFPLDETVDAPVLRMEVAGAPDEVPDVQADLIAEVAPAAVGSLERFAFYEAAKRAYAIVATGERRFYGDVILRKGVVPPEA